METTRIRTLSAIGSVCVCVLACMSITVEAGRFEDMLIKRFFKDEAYYVSSRPVRNESDALDVQFGLSLHQIIEVNEKNEQLHTNMWLRYAWIDYKLSWDVAEYGGVTSIRLPSDMVWTPDILLYNSASEAIDSKFPTNVVVSHTGEISWVPLGLYTSACAIDITWFPFDDQMCTLKFGSWTYDGNKINLTSMEDNIDMSTYSISGEWDVVGVPAKRSVVMYDCCPEPYIDITFTIHIRRRTLYYGINLIIPCAMISFLALLTFILPPDEGEKIGLGITVLLALSVFQMIVSEAVPATSLATPVLGIYFSTMMTMSTLSVITTVIVLNFHHRNPDMYDMPDWVRVLFCEWLAWILRIKRPGRDLSLQAILRRRRVRQLEALSPPSASLINNVKDIDNTIPLSNSSSSAAQTAGVAGSTPASYHGAPPPVFIRVPPGANSTPASAPPMATCGADIRETGNNNLKASGGVMMTSYIGGYYDVDKGSPADPTVAALGTGLSTTMNGLRSELLSILNELRWMTNKMKDDAEAGEATNDWKFVAMVVDRLCLWIFTVYLVVGTLYVFLRAPNLYVS